MIPVVITIKRHDATHDITLSRARAGNGRGFGEWVRVMEIAHHQDRKMSEALCVLRQGKDFLDA